MNALLIKKTPLLLDPGYFSDDELLKLKNSGVGTLIDLHILSVLISNQSVFIII